MSPYKNGVFVEPICTKCNGTGYRGKKVVKVDNTYRRQLMEQGVRVRDDNYIEIGKVPCSCTIKNGGVSI